VAGRRDLAGDTLSLVIVWHCHPIDVDLSRQDEPWRDPKAEPSFEDVPTEV
jgi:hypothetical protein